METPDASQEAELVALLTAHQSALRLYVNALMPGDSAAADVAQQANSTIWRKRADFTPGTHFKAWIFAIARNEVRNYRKQSTREKQRLVFSETLEDLIAEELPHVSEALETRQQALRRCLAKLRDRDRELIQQRYVHRTPLKDYALETNRSVGGLKVTLHRVRNALAACIRQQLAASS